MAVRRASVAFAALSLLAIPAGSGTMHPHGARFELIQKLAGPDWTLGNAFGLESSWSPDGRRLILRHSSGFVVADRAGSRFALHPESRVVFPFTWSPDGEWIAYKAQRSVVAVHLLATEAETLAIDTDLWPVVWASDGAIYGWSHHERHRYVPRAFQRAKSFPYRNRLLVVPGGTQFIFRPGESASESDLSGVACAPCLAWGPFADGRFFLISTTDNDRNGDALVDSSGTMVRRIPVTLHPGGEIDWTSMSSDGRWIVGDLEHDVGEGQITACDLYLTDSTGAWRIKVANAGDAMLPECCPTEDIVAFSDPVHGGVSIGRIVTR